MTRFQACQNAKQELQSYAYYELRQFLKLSVSNASPEGRQACSRYVEQVQNVFCSQYTQLS